MTSAPVSRRAVLLLLGGAAVAACTPSNDAGEPTVTPDIDAGVRDEVAAREWALIALYDAAIASQPTLEAQLAPLREQHLQHASALGSSSPSAMASSSPVPFTNADAVRATLAEAEATAARDRAAACQRVVGTEPARLLALIAASEAGHAAFLRGGAS